VTSVPAVARLLESRRSRISRWAGAAIVVSGLHVGAAALGVTHWQEETADDAAGGLTVEMALLPEPAPVDTPDVAHGPVQQEAKLAPEAAKQAVEEVEKDIPPVDPSPAPDPEVVLPKPQPDTKEQPKEEEAREPVPDKQVPRQDTEAPLTTAPPRVEAEPAPSSAPAEGDKAARARAEANWQSDVMRQLNRYKRVPDAARLRRGRWEVVVAFTLDRAGQIVDAHIGRSSGVAMLDQEALALVRRVRFPPPPGDTLSFSLPISFEVR
jgi:periplasmic protein TonB